MVPIAIFYRRRRRTSKKFSENDLISGKNHGFFWNTLFKKGEEKYGRKNLTKDALFLRLFEDRMKIELKF